MALTQVGLVGMILALLVVTAAAAQFADVNLYQEQ